MNDTSPAKPRLPAARALGTVSSFDERVGKVRVLAAGCMAAAVSALWLARFVRVSWHTLADRLPPAEA